MFYTTFPKYAARPHSIARYDTRPRDGPDGDRPCANLCSDSGRRRQSGALLHALDHAFLRARIRVLCGDVGLAPPREATWHPRALAFPVTARFVARIPRAHRDALRVDVQLRRHQLQPGGRAVDDRLEHDCTRSVDLAAIHV